MKRNVNKSVLVAGFLFTLFALAQVLCLCTITRTKNVIPTANSVYCADGTGLTMGQAQSFGGFSGVAIGALSTPVLREINVPVRNITESVSASFATPEIQFCVPLQFVFGGWFLRCQEPNLQAQAIIPESLSLTLFGTNKPSKLSFYIDRQEYYISGVYRESNGFLSKTSDNRVPRVYLSDALRMANLPVTTLYLSKFKGYTPEYLLQQASGFQNTMLHGNIINYPQQIALLHGLWYLSVLICYFFLASLLLITSERFFSAALFGHTNCRKLRDGIIGIGIAIGTGGGLLILLTNMYIPNAYLPTRHILDFSFYKTCIITFFRNMDTAGDMNAYLERMFLWHTLTLLFLALLGITFFCLGVLQLWKTLDRSGLRQ